MDYKEIAGILRKENLHLIYSYSDIAATAIETLLAERDAATEDLRGYCRTCAHANTGATGLPCAKCKHLGFYGTQEIDGWEWRGPQKESGGYGKT